jgi:hypothetical protein
VADVSRAGDLEFAERLHSLAWNSLRWRRPCVSVFCVAKPLGGPKVDLSEPAHLIGGFVSRTNWALVLIGAIPTVGGVAATTAIV